MATRVLATRFRGFMCGCEVKDCCIANFDRLAGVIARCRKLEAENTERPFRILTPPNSLMTLRNIARLIFQSG
jgi:hypothetical protein